MFTSVLIAIGVVILFHVLRNELQFAPFRVRVRLTRACLLDHKLTTNERLHALTSVSDTSPLARGIGFSVLRVGTFYHGGTLVFWEDWKSFSTDIDEVHVSFTELPLPASAPIQMLGRDTVIPSMYLDRTADGLNIGVAVPGATDPHVVATLPWAVFGVRQWRSGRMSAKALHKRLKANGWERDPRELGDPQPHGLTHKYALVEWTYL